MYRPRSFACDDLATLHEFIEAHSFATLITPGSQGFEISHIPLLLTRDGSRFGTLHGHLARPNPHWRRFVDDAPPSVAIFHGPHGYISPGWYASPQSVPTWNYAVVHAAGRPRLLRDDAALRELVMRTVNVYEQPIGSPWDVAAAGGAIDAELGGIVGFTMPIERLDGKFKLSQNRSAVDHSGVVAALAQSGAASNPALAALMREFPPPV